MKNRENKTEIFKYIRDKISHDDIGGKLLLTAISVHVLPSTPCDTASLQPCNFSKADTRIILHLAHAASQGHQRDKRDSDVVVLAVHFFSILNLFELWVCFGKGKKVRDIPIHEICAIVHNLDLVSVLHFLYSMHSQDVIPCLIFLVVA